MTLSPITGSDPRKRSWTDDDSVVAGESRAAGRGGGLASLSFIGAALRRRAWLWCLIAVVGVLAALAFKEVFPPAYQASTSILMVYTSDQNPAEAIQTDIALAQSRPVAVDAMRKLGLPQTPQNFHNFLAAYSVGQITDRVIGITVSAPSSSEAVARTRVLATDFLRFRARELQTQQELAVAAINHQIVLNKRQLAVLTKEIAAISPASASSAQPTVAVGSLSRAEKARLATLNARRTRAQDTLTGLEQAAQGYPVGTASMIHGSEVLDAAAPVHRSQLRLTVLYAWGGLVAGLTLGLGLVIVQALVSGRLRRRDDIARALGAPVHLSVGRLRAGRWRRGRRGRDRDVRRLVAHLRSAVPARAGGAGALAVVAVDNAKEVAPSLVALAVSYAQEGRQVVLADLAGGAPAARLLGITKPGTGTARVHGVPLAVTVPRDSAAPAGPLPQAGPATASEVPPDVYFSADVLLSLATLDPALGADYLPTWASGAVVVVTAGRSSWARIHAVGEMIRLARTPLVSAVLVGADKTDESVGAAPKPVKQRGPARVGNSR